MEDLPSISVEEATSCLNILYQDATQNKITKQQIIGRLEFIIKSMCHTDFIGQARTPEVKTRCDSMCYLIDAIVEVVQTIH